MPATAKNKKKAPDPDSIAHQPDNTVALVIDGERYLLRAPRTSEYRELFADYRSITETALERSNERVAAVEKRAKAEHASANAVSALARRLTDARVLSESLYDPEGDEVIEKAIVAWWVRAVDLLDTSDKTLPEDADRLPAWLPYDMALIGETFAHWQRAQVRKVPRG